MRRWFAPTLILGWLWAVSTLVLAQTPAAPSPHVYLLNIGGCTQPPLERRQTGFRVNDKNLVGIVTALHGVVDCATITATADQSAAGPLVDLTLTQVDIARDMALLGSNQLSALPVAGLTPETKAAPRMYEGLQVIGYHSGISRQAPPEAVTLRETTALFDLVPDPLLRALGKRGSPALDMQVLNLNGNLLPGHSGAPILNGNGRLVGVGNGGIDLGRVGWGWAIPWQDIAWKRVAGPGETPLSPEEKKQLEDLKTSNPQLVFSFATLAGSMPTPPPTKTTPARKPKLIIKVTGAGSARSIELVAPPGGEEQ